MTEPPNPHGDATPGPQPDPTAPPPYSMPGDTPPASPPPGASYGPSAGGGYPPAGDFPPPAGPTPHGTYYGAGGTPAGYANNEEKTWAMVAHFGGAAGTFFFAYGGFVGPLVALLAKGKESPTVRAHAVAALNFQLTWIGAALALWVVLCCATVVTLGFGALLGFVLVVPWLMGVVFGVIGGVKANEGQLYRYPMSISFVK